MEDDLSVGSPTRNHAGGTGSGCDVNPSNGHRDFVSWLGDGEGERYQQVAGQVDRLSILDVRESRVLVDATYSPDASEADRDVLDQIATSIRFPRRLT